MPLTIDDVAAKMRERFTPESLDKPVLSATITAEEWNVLASVIYLRDMVQTALETEKGEIDKDAAREAIDRAKGVVVKKGNRGPA